MLDLEKLSACTCGLTPRSQQQIWLTPASSSAGWKSTGNSLINPADRLRHPAKPPRRCFAVPTEKQVERLLARPTLETAWGLRDRAWLEMAYTTGARRNEMAPLPVADVDLRQGMLRLLGKGGKERLVPLGRQAVHWLKSIWNEGRPKLLKGKTTRRFGSVPTAGGPRGYAAIRRQLRTHTRKVGLPASLLTAAQSAPGLRHAHARPRAAPPVLQELLGPRSEPPPQPLSPPDHRRLEGHPPPYARPGSKP